jgi:hypothetical protein
MESRALHSGRNKSSLAVDYFLNLTGTSRMLADEVLRNFIQKMALDREKMKIHLRFLLIGLTLVLIVHRQMCVDS